MEELKAYVEERIAFIIATRGKHTQEEQELQKVLEQINAQVEQ